MWLAGLATAVSAGAFYFCTGFNHVWWSAWIAPIPVLLVAFRMRGRIVWVAPFAAYLIGTFHIALYLHMFTGWPLAIAILILMAWAFQACILFARSAVMQLPSWVGVWAFPVAWTSYEFLVALLSPYGTFFNYAYSQMDALPVIQIASVTGILGVSFAVMLWCSLSAMWSKPSEPAIILLMLIFGFGLSRLEHRGGPPTTAGLITADAGIRKSWSTEDPQQAVAIANAWSDRIAKVAAQGARVIVLPEKFLAITPADQQQVYSVFGNTARKTRTTVVAGFNFIGIHPRRNVADVFAPNRQPVVSYDKRHLLQGPETGYLTGEQPGLFIGQPGNWGVEICKDMDYPAWSRLYGKQSIQFLAVPAWDFIEDAWLHDRMAVMRGVENGFSIVRVAQQGLLTVSDAYGRILAERKSYTAPEVLLVEALPAGPGTTFYARYGDWFGWLNLLALAGLIAARLRAKKTLKL